MADTYDEAATQIDQQKAAELAAIAQFGSQGQSAFIQAQNDVRGQREQAINAAIAEAAARGAPQAMLDQMRGQVAQPYDRRLADMTSAAGMQGYDQSRRLADLESYFGQVKAAIPAMRSISQTKLAQLQAAHADDAYKQSLSERRLALDERKLELEEARGGKPKTAKINGLDGDLVDELKAKPAYAVARKRVDELVASGLGRDEVKRRINNFVSLSSQPAMRQLLIGELNTYAPSSAGKVTKLYEPKAAAQRAGVNYRSLSTGKNFNSTYKYGLDTYDNIPKGKTLADADRILAAGYVKKWGHDFPELRRLLRTMYGGR